MCHNNTIPNGPLIKFLANLKMKACSIKWKHMSNCKKSTKEHPFYVLLGENQRITDRNLLTERVSVLFCTGLFQSNGTFTPESLDQALSQGSCFCYIVYIWSGGFWFHIAFLSFNFFNMIVFQLRTWSSSPHVLSDPFC